MARLGTAHQFAPKGTTKTTLGQYMREVSVMATGTVELRVQLNEDELSVIDGYCSGTGQDRTKVVRRILREWSEAKLHEATVVLRVAKRNPTVSASGRD